MLHCYICYICYIATLLHCYISNSNSLDLIQIRSTQPKTKKLRPFSKAASWVDPNQTSKLQSYKATGIFRTHYLNFKLKQPWSDPNQINPTQNYKATATFNGFILSRSKSDFQTPKLRSYRHISNALPEFQTQTALNLSRSDQSNPKLQSYAHFQRQHLE